MPGSVSSRTVGGAFLEYAHTWQCVAFLIYYVTRNPKLIGRKIGYVLLVRTRSQYNLFLIIHGNHADVGIEEFFQHVGNWSLANIQRYLARWLDELGAIGK